MFGITLASAPFVVLALGFFWVIYYFFLKPFRNDLRCIKDEMGGMYNATREIQKCIKEDMKKDLLHDLPNKNLWASSGSPLYLSDSGKKLLQDSGLGRIISDNEAELIRKLKERKPQTAYDVEKEAFLVLADFISEKEDANRTIKNFIFNNPQIEGRNIDFPDLAFVGSISLRDVYLDKNPSLKQDD